MILGFPLGVLYKFIIHPIYEILRLPFDWYRGNDIWDGLILATYSQTFVEGLRILSENYRYFFPIVQEATVFEYSDFTSTYSEIPYYDEGSPTNVADSPDSIDRLFPLQDNRVSESFDEFKEYVTIVPEGIFIPDDPKSLWEINSQ